MHILECTATLPLIISCTLDGIDQLAAQPMTSWFVDAAAGYRSHDNL